MVARSSGKQATKAQKAKEPAPKKGRFMDNILAFREKIGEEGIALMDIDDALKGVRHTDEARSD